MTATFFTNLALGTITSMVGTIMALATWITGSVIYQGNLFFDTTNNTTPAIILNQQAAVTFQADGDVELGSGDLLFNSTRNPRPCLVDGSVSFHCSDRVTMAAPTGATNHFIAAALNPFSGTGIVIGRATTVLCDGTPNSMTADISISTSATGSGTVLASDNNRAVASGNIMTFSGLYLVPKDQYFTIVSTSGSNVTRGAPDCDLVPYWVEV